MLLLLQQKKVDAMWDIDFACSHAQTVSLTTDCKTETKAVRVPVKENEKGTGRGQRERERDRERRPLLTERVVEKREGIREKGKERKIIDLRLQQHSFPCI